MKILVTAFDPFGGEKINPALEAVKQLENTIGEHTISKLEIPTVFHESKDVIDKELANGNYDVVLSIGQAGGRYDLTPERCRYQYRRCVFLTTKVISLLMWPFRTCTSQTYLLKR